MPTYHGWVEAVLLCVVGQETCVIQVDYRPYKVVQSHWRPRKSGPSPCCRLERAVQLHVKRSGKRFRCTIGLARHSSQTKGSCVYALYVYCCVGYFGELTKLWLTIVDLNVSGNLEDQEKTKTWLYTSFGGWYVFGRHYVLILWFYNMVVKEYFDDLCFMKKWFISFYNCKIFTMVFWDVTHCPCFFTPTCFCCIVQYINKKSTICMSINTVTTGSTEARESKTPKCTRKNMEQ